MSNQKQEQLPVDELSEEELNNVDGGDGGKATFSEFTIKKTTDSTSPTFFSN